jgi:hypothetical protein
MSLSVVEDKPFAGVDVTWRRLGGVLGVIGVVGFIIGSQIIEGDYPDVTSSVDEARTWFADNGRQYLVGDYVSGISIMFFLLPALLILHSLLAEAEGARRIWSRYYLVGVIFFYLIAGASSAFSGALAAGISSIDNDATVRALQYMDFYSFSASLPLTAAILQIGAGLVIVRTGLMWRWLGWLAFVVAIANVVGAAVEIHKSPEGALAGVLFAGLIGTAIWFLLVSINMLAGSNASSEARS